MFGAERYVTMFEPSAAAVCFKLNVTFCGVRLVTRLQFDLLRHLCFSELYSCVNWTCLLSLGL